VVRAALVIPGTSATERERLAWDRTGAPAAAVVDPGIASDLSACAAPADAMATRRARRAGAEPDPGDRWVAKAVARVEWGWMADAIVRPDARCSRPWTSAG
jgi:hypothetical protein